MRINPDININLKKKKKSHAFLFVILWDLFALRFLLQSGETQVLSIPKAG
jgi:hypothetical protein